MTNEQRYERLASTIVSKLVAEGVLASVCYNQSFSIVLKVLQRDEQTMAETSGGTS